MPAIQAVIFDLFGTLVDNFRQDEYVTVVTAMSDVLDVPAPEFAAAIRPLIRDSMVGAYDIAGECVLACAAMGMERSPDLGRQATEVWRQWARRLLATPRLGALDTLRQLKQRGVRLGLISDCADDIPELWPECPLAPWFDAPAFSCRERLMKPDPELYRRVCERLAAEPEAALYVGDTKREVEGARAAGMTAIRIQVPHETDQSHWADREPWDGPVIARLPAVLGWVGDGEVAEGNDSDCL